MNTYITSQEFKRINLSLESINRKIHFSLHVWCHYNRLKVVIKRINLTVSSMLKINPACILFDDL